MVEKSTIKKRLLTELYTCSAVEDLKFGYFLLQNLAKLYDQPHPSSLDMTYIHMINEGDTIYDLSIPKRKITKSHRRRRFQNENSANGMSTSALSNETAAETILSTGPSSTQGRPLRNLAALQKWENSTWDFGPPTCLCEYCGAIHWLEEKTSKSSKSYPTFNMCCLEGRVQLPLLQRAPQPLANLLTNSNFRRDIRKYNSLFAFTSMGGKVDTSLTNSRGTYAFRISGHNYHRIGSLLPTDGKSPSFAQLYVYDTEHELNNRLKIFSNGQRSNDINPTIVASLTEMLNDHNPLVQSFRSARERFAECPVSELRIKLIAGRGSDARVTNLPTASEVAAIIVGSEESQQSKRDIIVEHKTEGVKRINENHPSFMALQYPLLFPYGEDGFSIETKYRDSTTGRNYKRDRCSQREYYAFRLHQRRIEESTIISGGRLFLQYITDAYMSVEEQRFTWFRLNQGPLRSDLYKGLCDALSRGDTQAKQIGKKTILPSSHVGGPRYREQNYQDAMAICRYAGYPDLFITFTCNPKWKEIEYLLREIPGQKAEERVDIVNRVFYIKLKELLYDLRKNNIFGKSTGVVYTIEFQKRGLPHAHILLFLHSASKIQSPTDIDDIISAEIPDKLTDPVGYDVVQQHMLHGPCGVLDSSCSCMVGNKCSKNFPKKYNPVTSIDEDGFPLYRRREDGRVVEKNEKPLDNRYVVPYNRALLVKYRAHINVEICNRTRAVKYLFKYIHKGPDKAIFVFSDTNENDTQANYDVQTHVDEIKQYVNGRYIGASEACWRIFEFAMFVRKPSVERLSLHLKDEQPVQFRENETITDVLSRTTVKNTMLTEWMETNKRDPSARELTYPEFPKSWVWHADSKTWRKRHNGDSIGRMYYIPPTSGEIFYLRQLLNVQKGCKDFTDIRTVNGVTYQTYKEACYALGLLEDDKEWNDALSEANTWAMPGQLRQLFATILAYCEVIKPFDLWEAHWPFLAYDIERRQRTTLNFPELQLSDAEKQSFCLLEIDNLLRQSGKKLADFEGMPQPNTSHIQQLSNRFLAEETRYNISALQQQYTTWKAMLNMDQKKVHDSVLQSIYTNAGKVFFVSGYGGTGKTFLWKTLLCQVRSTGRIALAVASSGIAALLLPGGRTAHSRFHIPVDITPDSTCSIKRGTQLAALLLQTSLIIWDEAPMANKYNIEAVDKTLRDILAQNNPANSYKPFGGITTVLAGDFRQTLPILKKATREETVTSSFKMSSLWQCCQVFNLTRNMRLDNPNVSQQERREIANFSNWILDIGNGTLCDESGEGWIQIPTDLLLEDSVNPIQTIVESTYPNLESNLSNIEYLTERAVLTPYNETVEEINSYMMASLPGEEHVYLSADSVATNDYQKDENDMLYPLEFLNSLYIPGVPNHRLCLKVGFPVMLLRNLNQSLGLCNGTRLVVTRLNKWSIEARIITGSHAGETVLLPRIGMTSPDKKWPFTLKRRQYPLALCFAMTINKSQGQSLSTVGIYLPKQVFTHGQLYVAVSRITRRDGMKILNADPEAPSRDMVKNIVFKEVI